MKTPIMPNLRYLFIFRTMIAAWGKNILVHEMKFVIVFFEEEMTLLNSNENSHVTQCFTVHLCTELKYSVHIYIGPLLTP